jgi:hypothetical protein
MMNTCTDTDLDTGTDKDAVADTDSKSVQIQMQKNKLFSPHPKWTDRINNVKARTVTLSLSVTVILSFRSFDIRVSFHYGDKLLDVIWQRQMDASKRDVLFQYI